MADAITTNRSTPTDLLPDVAGVKSRVSWPAVLGGSIVAIAVYFVFTLLLAATGISLGDAGFDHEKTEKGVVIAMLLSIVVSLFIGGYITSQLTVGENRHEAIIYGVLTWATTTALMLFLAGTVIKGGYLAIVNGSSLMRSSERVPSIEEVAKKAGYSDKDIADFKAKATDPNRIKELDTPENRDKVSKAAVATSWTALVGVMLSMAAAIGGALAGVGTQFRLFPVAQYGGVRRTTGTVTTTGAGS